MKTIQLVSIALAAAGFALAAPSSATGLATCASGSQDGWQPQVPTGSKDHKG